MEIYIQHIANFIGRIILIFPVSFNTSIIAGKISIVIGKSALLEGEPALWKPGARKEKVGRVAR